MRIRKGDSVVVRTGKHHGQRGDVVRTLPPRTRWWSTA